MVLTCVTVGQSFFTSKVRDFPTIFVNGSKIGRNVKVEMRQADANGIPGIESNTQRERRHL